MHDITGPRAFTYQQLAGVLADETRKPVRFIDTPPRMTAKVLRRQGHSDWHVRHLVDMAQMFRAGAGSTVSTSVRDLTGRAPRSIEAFAREYADSFDQAGTSPLVLAVSRVGLGLVARAASVAQAAG